MLKRNLSTWVAAFAAANRLSLPALAAPAIPLPEHPRPDFERADWLNLNGSWQFRFDQENAGEGADCSIRKNQISGTEFIP